MNNAELQFLSPNWLWLLLPLWSYLIWWFKTQTKQSSHSIAEADPAAGNHFYHPFADKLCQLSEQTNQPFASRHFWKKPPFWWYGLALSFLVAALSQPILIGERLPDPPPERDIVFLVDTSISMQLKDYSLAGKPIKRMDLLRNLLDDFTLKMAGEHISIIIFAEEPYLLVPLSNDQYLIRRMLSRITTTLAGRFTAVGDALLLALNEAKKQKNRHQTFILFTDADKTLGKVTPLAAAKLVAESDIPIFTIAIGSSQKDQDRQIQGGLYQPVDLDLLKSIADISGGKSYQVNDTNAMQKALTSILEQRQNLAQTLPLYEKEFLYHYPLITGLLLLLFWQILRLLGIRYA